MFVTRKLVSVVTVPFLSFLSHCLENKMKLKLKNFGFTEAKINVVDFLASIVSVQYMHCTPDISCVALSVYLVPACL